MKTYVNILYSIIDKIDKWEDYDSNKKMNILNLYIETKHNNEKFLDYFEIKYIIICSAYNSLDIDFLKDNNHRTVPQLYWNNTHLNKFPTMELKKEHIEAEIDYDNYVGGVENWSVRKV